MKLPRSRKRLETAACLHGPGLPHIPSLQAFASRCKRQRASSSACMGRVCIAGLLRVLFPFPGCSSLSAHEACVVLLLPLQGENWPQSALISVSYFFDHKDGLGSGHMTSSDLIGMNLSSRGERGCFGKTTFLFLSTQNKSKRLEEGSYLVSTRTDPYLRLWARSG